MRALRALLTGLLAVLFSGVLGALPASAACVSSSQPLALNSPGQVVVYHTCGGDDVAYEIPLRNPVLFDGVYYDKIYATTNATITFGASDITYWDYPPTPSISLVSRDWYAPETVDQTKFDITISDGGFQVEMKARRCCNWSDSITTMIITGIINQNGTVDLSYVQSGPLYGDERSGVRLRNGSVVSLATYGIGLVTTPPVVPSTPAADINFTDQAIDGQVARGGTYANAVSASGTGTIAYSVIDPSPVASTGQTPGKPSFLSLDPSTGALTGTAPSDSSADGTYVFRIRATATSGETSATAETNNLTVVVGAAPNLSALNASQTVTNGTSVGSISVAGASSYPTPTFALASGSLPAGLTLNTATGAISGTPTSQGASTFAITATNRFGSSTSPTQTITVNRSPRFTSAGETITVRGVTGNSYSSGVSALGWPAPTFTEAVEGTLPPGLTVDSATGEIRGIPTTTGVFHFAIRATNSLGYSDTAERTLTIGSVPVVVTDTYDAVGYVNSPYSATPSFSGYPAPTYSIGSGALPAGLTLNETTGEVSGTPSVSGDFTFAITATNFAGTAQTESHSLHLYGAPIFANASEFPITILRGGAYSGHVNFNGFVDAYSERPCGCSTSDGSYDGLPAGLSINPETGEISGTATVPGTYHFKVRAYSVNRSNYADSPIQTIEVRTVPIWSDSSLEWLAPIGYAYWDSVSATAYPAAVYTLSGTIPTGMVFNSGTGALAGTPTVSGQYNFSITASNVAGETSTESYSITVSKPPVFTIAGQTISDHAVVGSYFVTDVSALGFPAPTYSLVAGSLPPGMILNIESGQIRGTPTTPGSYDFTIRARNDYGYDDTVSLNIVVGSVPSVTGNVTTLTGYVGNTYSDSAIFNAYPLPTFSVNGDGLPNGMSINPSTGLISGTPTESGYFHFAVVATNFAGSTATATYELHIFAEPVYRNAEVPGIVLHNSNYSGRVNFYGPVDEYAVLSCGCSLGASEYNGLPPGLSVNPETGVIAGTATEPGTYKFIIRGYSPNHLNHSESPVQTIVVRQIPYFTETALAPTAPISTAYTDSVSATGYPAPTYSTSGNFPAGLTINPTTGAISGSPTASGTYTFSVVASNIAGSATTNPYTMVVSQAPIPVDDRIPAAILRNEPFTDTLTYTAYPAPLFSIASGSLPAGLTLNRTTGVISGTPTELGSFTFRVGVNSPGYYEYTSPIIPLDIEQVPVVTDGQFIPIVPVGRAVTDGIATEAYPAASYSVTRGTLPAGLKLDPALGTISGTATTSGNFSFDISATNVRGTTVIPITGAVHQAPGQPILTLAPEVTLGNAVNGYTAVTGYPAPTFFLAGGALPSGVSLDRTTGRITGTPTTAGNFSFTIGALNDQGSAQSTAFSLSVLSPGANIDFAVPVGQPALGAPVAVQSEGLAPSVEYTITVRSTPQIVGTGTTTRLGQLLAQVKIPENLEPGWHSITLDTRAVDGSPLAEVAWFEITATGLLETISESEPSASEKAAALTDDDAFYEKMGIDPGTQVEPEEVANTVQDVTSVVASVALVSAAAAATAAVASAAAAASAASAASAAGSAASAGGAASSSAGAARTATPGGSSSASSSGGSSSGSARGASSGSSGGSGSSSGSSGSSGGSSGSSGASGDGGEESSDYGNLEAEHDDFHVEAVKWGDALSWWSVPFMTVLDRITVAATEYTSRVSPVLSRIINDGAYLRAMIGGAMVVPYIASVVLGAASVDLSADSLASAGNVATLSIILVLGTVDALAGLLGIISFTVVSVSVFGIHSLGDIRYLLAMFIAGFAPIILSTTFRKIRRPGMETLSDVWERIVDVFMIAFVSSLTTLSVVGGISAFAGASVPLADAAKGLVFVITGVALARIILEEIAARSFAGRLDAINPTEVSGPGMTQQWVSLVFKYVVLTLMIGDMVGWGWWLWLGALVMFIPGIMGMTLTDLPKSKLLTQLIPGGLAALLLATLLSTWSGEIVGALFEGSDMYGPFAFLLVPLPVIIVAIVGMFAEGGEKWYVERNLKWVYVVGGIGVFASTIWATDFFGQIFG